jgi:hypothetical protein
MTSDGAVQDQQPDRQPRLQIRTCHFLDPFLIRAVAAGFARLVRRHYQGPRRGIDSCTELPVITRLLGLNESRT